MSQYYLMAQLPSLDGLSDTAPLPISEERFLELCERLLPPKTADVVAHLTLLPPRKKEATPSPFVNAWNDKERQFREVLCRVRAAKRHNVQDPIDTTTPEEMRQVAMHATQMNDPMEAERYLCAYRLGVLESQKPFDTFSDEMVYYYGLKLKLLARMRGFDATQGRAAYEAMYHSILTGETQEAVQ